MKPVDLAGRNETRLGKILRSLLRFATCRLGGSIDGHGAVYEYVRYPARWGIIERNLRRASPAEGFSNVFWEAWNEAAFGDT